MKQLSLSNRLLQKGAFLRHSSCIALRKRYEVLNKSAHLIQLSPGVSFNIRATALKLRKLMRDDKWTTRLRKMF